MLIIGLSGTVASGKNFIANIFKDFGAVVFDADLEVHKLLSNDDEIIKKIAQYFPKAVISNKINREILGGLVFVNKENLIILENIIHPEITNMRQKFISNAKLENNSMVILNIPLLFEKKIYKECDYNILIKSSVSLQRARFIAREVKKNPDLNKNDIIAKFENILQNQSENSQKEKLADFILQNNQDKSILLKNIKEIFNNINK